MFGHRYFGARYFGGEVSGWEEVPESLVYHGSGGRRLVEDEYELARKREELLELRRKAADERRALAKAEAPLEIPAVPEPTPASVPSGEGARAPVLPVVAFVDPSPLIDERVGAFTDEQARAGARAAAQVAELLAEAKRKADEELMLMAVALAVADEDD